MRPEMDEFDWVEQRLRRAVAGNQPTAPDRLRDFVDMVPAANRRAGRIGLALERPRIRRGFFAVAAVAAVAVAVVGSAALVSYRQVPAESPTPEGIVSDGWAWQATDGTLYFAELEVPHGFIATCGRNSDQRIVDQTLCSSPDGLHWSVPADEAIVSAEGADPFLPFTVLVHNGIYLATSSRGSGEFQGPAWTLWRSTDGVHWSEVDTAESLGATKGVDLMVVAPDGFLAAVSTDQAGSPPEEGLFISNDGYAWSKASDLPFETGAAGSGYYMGPTTAAGLYAAGVSPDGGATQTWRTTDGRHWTVVAMPAGYSELGSVVTLPDGSLRGLASSFDTSATNVIVSSTDGLSWRIDPSGPAGSVDALAVVGDRMVAYVSSETYTDPHQVLQSDDWGKSWRPLPDLTGKPVVGAFAPLGGHLEIRGADLATHWLLTPVQRGAATPVPTEPAQTESPSATESATQRKSPAEPSEASGPTIEAPVGTPSDAGSATDLASPAAP
jgi:hypothetical protein